MLRVIFAVDNLNVGGTELNAFRTARSLHQSHAEITLLALQKHGPLAESYRAAGIEIQHFPISSLVGADTFRRQREVYRFLKALRPDVFHAHDKYSNIFGLPVAKAAGVPAVIGSRRWNKADDGRALALANRAAYGFADRVLFNSRRLQELVSARERIPRRRGAVVPNFLEPDAFLPPAPPVRRAWQDELRIESGVPVVGSVANLRPIKDHASLLRAMALLAQQGTRGQTVLVGAGDRQPLAELARALDIEMDVHFAGPRPSRPSFHYLFDISTLTSLSEGFSNSVLEAMAAGKPVVATDVGGIPDAVFHGDNGLLVPPADPRQLADALLHLIANPSIREDMGRRGRERASAEYTEEAVIARLLALYGDLLARRPHQSKI